MDLAAVGGQLRQESVLTAQSLPNLGRLRRESARLCSARHPTAVLTVVPGPIYRAAETEVSRTEPVCRTASAGSIC